MKLCISTNALNSHLSSDAIAKDYHICIEWLPKMEVLTNEV